MTIFQTFIDVLVGAQTEVAVFLIAIIAHVVLFGNYRIKPASEKAKQSKQVNSDTSVSGGEGSPSFSLARNVNELVNAAADTDRMISELNHQCQSLSKDELGESLLGVLETFGKTTPIEVFQAIRAVAQARSLQLDARLGELMLRTALSLQRQSEFDEILASLQRANQVSSGIALLALRAALSVPSLELAIDRLCSFSDQWNLSAELSPSTAPKAVMYQIVRLAAEKNYTMRLVNALSDREVLTPWMFECILNDCAQKKDHAKYNEVWACGLKLGVELTVGSYCSSIRMCNDEKTVIEVYEQNLKGTDLSTDVTALRQIAIAASHAKRHDIMNTLAASTTDSAKLAGVIKGLGADGLLEVAVTLFDASAEKNTTLYNTMASACVDCKDLATANRILAEALEKDVADVVSFNTMIKAHILSGKSSLAHQVLDTMQGKGLSPNHVTFNELIDAAIKTDMRAAWKLLEHMEALGLKPSTVTCSILLKSMNRNSRPADIDRTMALLDSTDDMDEVLLGSVCEACIRAERSDLLLKQLTRQRSKSSVRVKTAHTFGSLIRAYGYVGDTKGTWETWRDMQAQGVVPTSVTTGCMVESLVSSGNVKAGYDLIRELIRDDKTRSLVNAVVYCSVLKGYSHQKKFPQVWAIYKEMRAEGVQLSIVTYNALIDACARCSEMSRVPDLLREMDQNNIEANIVTYSTIVKGYCNDSKLDKAFDLVKDMKTRRDFKPDEITYNTLLDGCARQGLYKRGVAVLHEMEAEGVPPSNFTLSLLAKLASRSEAPERAFELCESLAKKYKIRWNVHVYNNLVLVCSKTADAKSGLKLFEQMLERKVCPDARTYTLLLRTCVQAKRGADAAALLCAATGVRAAHSNDSWQCSMAKVRGGLPGDVVSEAIEGILGKCGYKELGASLVTTMGNIRGMKLDSRLLKRVGVGVSV